MRTEYIRGSLRATREGIVDVALQVDILRDWLGDILDGTLADQPEQEAYQLLATWAGLLRIRPHFLDERDARGEIRRAEQAIEKDANRLCELAMAVPNTKAWLQAVESFSADLEDGIDSREETELACDLLSDLDEADLMLYAVRSRGLSAEEIARNIEECNHWLAAHANMFVAASVFAQAVGQAMSPDLLSVDPALASTATKFVYVLDAAVEFEKRVSFASVKPVNLDSLLRFCGYSIDALHPMTPELPAPAWLNSARERLLLRVGPRPLEGSKEEALATQPPHEKRQFVERAEAQTPGPLEVAGALAEEMVERVKGAIGRLFLPPLPAPVYSAASRPLPVSSLPLSESRPLKGGGELHCAIFHDPGGRVLVTFRTSARQLEGGRILLTAMNDQTGKEVLRTLVKLKPDDGGVLRGTFDLSVLDRRYRHTIEYGPDMNPA